MTPSSGKPQIESLRLNAHAPNMKIDAPGQVFVMGSETAGGQQ